MQAEMAASGLGGNPTAPAENLALLGALEEDEAPKGPTMMGREARQLMLSGQGAAGLAAWKVSAPHAHAQRTLPTRLYPA